ncbi:hypothetical protein O0L34_g19370 [Tuta absoluta]|nr:hypothetical protein O0L34_g19370 [Tuta absoluta]
MSLTCPHCPGLTKTFTPHGLKVHIGRLHKGVASGSHATRAPSLCGDPHTTHANDADTLIQRVQPASNALEDHATLRNSVKVLRHISKVARNLAAGKMCEVINKCIETNEVADWYTLLTFAYSALRVPDIQPVTSPPR